MTAFVDPSAEVAADVHLGHGAFIGAGVRLGPGCVVGHHAVIHAGSEVGPGVRIDDHAVIGKRPMRAAASATTRADADAPAVIGAHCLIGTHAVLYAGCTLDTHVLVADLATVREAVTVGAYTIVGRGVAIEPHTQVGARCKLETNAYITAYSVLEDHVFVAPGVQTSNDAFLGRTEARLSRFKGITVRRGGRLGVGAVVLPGLEVGAEAVVGAGAVLTRDAAPGFVHLGVPARAVRPVPDEQKLGEEAAGPP